jgi:hypothetical protein
VGRAGDLITFMCRLSRYSGSLKLLEPSRPVLACIGIALPPCAQQEKVHDILEETLGAIECESGTVEVLWKNIKNVC